MASADLRDELTCSICLSIYTDPVTLTCGHSFCQVCIGKVLDTQEGSKAYRCPECRAEFQERPALEKNRKLCNIAEHFLSNHPEQGEEARILCTYCIQSSVSATKTCLLCEASLCENHLKVHSRSPEHVLTNPTTSFMQRKCSVHKKVLEYYCSEDASCICVSCSLAGEHRGHQLETLNEASEKKKKKLRDILQKLTSKREEIEESVQRLQKHRKNVQIKAIGVTEQVIDLIHGIRKKLDTLEERVLRDISRQQQQVSFRVSRIVRQLEIKKEELSRNIHHVEELCNTKDPLTVLQGRESDSANYCEAEDGNHENEECDEEMVNAVGDLDAFLISMTLHKGLVDIITLKKRWKNVPGASVMLPDVSVTSDISLDENTASHVVSISHDGNSVSFPALGSHCPETPGSIWDRQVISTMGFSSGQHYWAFEINESGNWIVGMAYPSINRKNMDSFIGMNNKSWGLGRWKNGPYTARYNAKETRLLNYPSRQIIGMYLDCEAGRLAFYELGDKIIHLHTFPTTFTEPLHVGLGVWDNLTGLGRITKINFLGKAY
ncbi:E3 ubiquitin-protein ligase TRIM39-like [Pelobates fuscus]|uniref:E3 ubiquitin-protein ligase TRIM39-like n=1 Tax=Pelobates fuscus TaxID=191477 RepID=UPI002FE4F0AD